MNEQGIVIHSYSRKEAIDDGVLIDVTDTAREAGFQIPVAVTSSVWSDCVTVPDGVVGQDERGRLWDVLTMLFFAVRNLRNSGSIIRYQLHVRNDNRDAEPPLVELKAICGPGDDESPCITIMFPDED
jgi:hypothetical protein